MLGAPVTTDEPSRSESPSLARRAFSIAGIAPLGLFLIAHLWGITSAFGGQAAYDAALARARGPRLVVLWDAALFASFAWHAAYGLRRIFAREPVDEAGWYLDRRARLLTRVTGGVVLAFLIWHLWEFPMRRWLGGASSAAFYPMLCAHLSATRWGVPWVALGYSVGVGACAYHAASGLWAACGTLGLRTGERSARALGWSCVVLGIALFGIGADEILYFATGSRAFAASGVRRVNDATLDANAPPAVPGK